MKLALAGTPVFARVALDALIAAGHEVVCVLTQPDRPAGRGQALQPSAVKVAAVAHGCRVLQPAGLRLDGQHADDAAVTRVALFALAPEAIVVVAYGLLLPPWVLDLPRYGCLNIHASLLPRWRGAAPIHRAIEAGDLTTGVCIMQMDAGLDTGGVLRSETLPILADDTTGRLHDRLAALGGKAIVAALADKAAGRDRLVPQPAFGVTYAAKIDKREADVDWLATADVIERRLRAFDPSPGASGQLAGESLKLWRGVVVPSPTVDSALVGTVLAADNAGLTVACGENTLRLVEVQRPGGKRSGVAPVLQHWARQGVKVVGMQFKKRPDAG